MPLNLPLNVPLNVCIFLNDRGKQSEDVPKEFRKQPTSSRTGHARDSQIDEQAAAGRELHNFVKAKVVRVSLNVYREIYHQHSYSNSTDIVLMFF